VFRFRAVASLRQSVKENPAVKEPEPVLTFFFTSKNQAIPNNKTANQNESSCSNCDYWRASFAVEIDTIETRRGYEL